MPPAASARRREAGGGAVLAGWAIAVALRLVYLTLRIRFVDRADIYARHARGERLVVAFWHDTIMLVPLLVTRLRWPGRVVAMLSQHRDAEIAGRALERLGIGTARGSSTRGGIAALRALLAAHRAGADVVVVPDGPRGPRHHAKDGIAQVARATRLPIVVFGAVASPARRLGSWDRLQVPWPFARVVLVSDTVEPGAAADPRQAVQDALERVTAEASAAVGEAAS
jgi:lysophospholipid acyltransferase (LPLAT)-like uncharacterized protein